MNGGEHGHVPHMRADNSGVLFGIVTRHHKQGQTPTSSLLMRKWRWFLVRQMLRTAHEREVFPADEATLLIQIPLKPGSSVSHFVASGLVSMHFYVAGLL